MEARSITCAICSTEFRSTRPQAKYCSKQCASVTAYRRYQYRRSGYGAIPSGTVGAIHEQVVAVDLMKRGYHVFRALSPSCPCDLAVVKDHALIRIEVRTGYRKLNGELYFPKQGTEPDHYAVVHSGGSVEYVPPLLTAQR